MTPNQTTIINPETNEKRSFNFDHCFWTHDGSTQDTSGVEIPNGPGSNFSGQNEVFNKIGNEVLDNAWTGYNCCLFAYGQTGSGKSYSMIGKVPNTGIVPRATEEMFIRIGKTTTDKKRYEVTYGMLEVYNEKVRDLLVPEESCPRGGLKVRERTNGECYAEGQKDMAVTSYAQIEKLMDYGNKNKTIGATKMNQESSRSHTIITIKFKQIELIGGKQSIKAPVINLIDLAGSEKASQTGAVGDRLKEGIAINQSLSTLGRCINILSEKASGKSKKEIVPFRDSVLTRLLQNALGGNSKTIMICALSPASSNYEETLNTLRYAERAKKIELKATIIESAQDKLIRELKGEIERLKKMTSGQGPQSDEDVERLKMELDKNKHAMNEMEKSWEERLKEASKKTVEADKSVNNLNSTVDLTKPHITNVNEDVFLNGRIVFNFDKPVIVGRKGATPQPSIVLGSIAIKPTHATIEDENNTIVLRAADADCCESIFINGKKATIKNKLNHLDRIIFGTNTAYIFKNPSKAAPDDDQDISYESIMQEKFEREKGQMNLQTDDGGAKGKAEAEAEVEYEGEGEGEENLNLGSKKEEDKSSKTMGKVPKKKGNTEKVYLEEKLTKLLPMVKEANLCAKELGRSITLDLKLAKDMPDWMGKNISKDLTKASTVVQIHVDNKEEGTHYKWLEDNFEQRVYLMRDIMNDYYETEKIPEWSPSNDPFWDDPEPELIGQGYLNLKFLAYLLENEAKMNLVDNSAKHVGAIYAGFKSTNAAGDGEPDDAPEDPNEILNKPIYFTMKIDKIVGLLKEYKDIYCQYKLPDPTLTFTTDKVSESTKNPEFHYEYRHSYDYVTKHLLDFLLESSICIKVYGYSLQGKKQKSQPPKKAGNESKEETMENDKKQADIVKKSSCCIIV